MSSLERIVLALLESGRSDLDPKALVAKAKEILAELRKEDANGA